LIVCLFVEDGAVSSLIQETFQRREEGSIYPRTPWCGTWKINRFPVVKVVHIPSDRKHLSEIYYDELAFPRTNGTRSDNPPAWSRVYSQCGVCEQERGWTKIAHHYLRGGVSD